MCADYWGWMSACSPHSFTQEHRVEVRKYEARRIDTPHRKGFSGCVVLCARMIAQLVPSLTRRQRTRNNGGCADPGDAEEYHLIETRCQRTYGSQGDLWPLQGACFYPATISATLGM